MAVSTDDLVIRAEMRSTVARTAREDKAALEDLNRTTDRVDRGGRRAAEGMTGLGVAGGKAGRGARDAADGAARAAREMGHAQDAQGRWRDSTGRFLSTQERANAGLRNTNDGLDRFTRKSSGASGAVGKLGGALAAVGFRAVVGGIATAGIGLAGFGALAVKVGGDYRDQMNTLQAVSGATAETMGRVATRAKELGADTSLAAVSAADAAGAMTELAKGGLSVDQAMLAAKGTLQLAGAAQVDAAEAARIQSAALNQFSLDADQATYVADVLANTANAAAGEVTDVGLALSYVGPVAASASIPIDDTAAAIGLMANQGIVGEKAGTALRGMLAGLSNPSAAAADALATLGIEAYDASGNFKGMEYLIGSLSDAQGRLTQESFNAAAATAFGREPLAAIVALANEGTDGFSAMSDAVNRAGGAQEVAAAKTKGLRGAIEGARSVLETVAITAYERFEPAAEAVVRWLTEKIEPAADRVFDVIDRLTVGGAARYDLLVKRDYTGGMFEAFGLAEDSAAVDYLLRFRDGLVDVVDWLGRNKELLLQVGIALAAGAATVKVLTTAMAVWRGVTTAVTIAQAILNGTMAVNPVMIVVVAIGALVAALVLAYQRSETFRDVVNAAWGAVRTGIGAVVDWLKGPGLDFVLTVWDAIATGAQWLWANVLQPVFGWIAAGFSALVTGIQWAWTNVLKPVWETVAAVAGWLWNTVLAVIFLAVKIAWVVLVEGIKLYWNNVLKPVWEAVATAAQWLWNNVLQPVFGWIGERWDLTLAGMKVIWETVLKPVFQAVGDVIAGLRPVFDTAVSGIGTAWDRLRALASAPINFVIDTVINKGIIGTFNKLADFFGTKRIDLVPNPLRNYSPPPQTRGAAGSSSRATEYATGGAVVGPGTGTSDSVPAMLSNGEYVIRAAVVRDVGTGWLDMLNAGQVERRAKGGFIKPAPGPITSPFGPRWGRMHSGVDWGTPTGTPVRAAADGRVTVSGYHSSWGNHVKLAHAGGLDTNYAHFSRLIARVGQIVKQGQVIGMSGNTGNSTGPHLHFEVYVGGRRVNPVPYLTGGNAGAGAGGGGGFSVLDLLRDFDPITKLFGDGLLSSPFGQLAGGLGRRFLDGAKDKLGSVFGIGGDVVLRDTGGPLDHEQVAVNLSGQREEVLSPTVSARLGRALDRGDLEGGDGLTIEHLSITVGGDGTMSDAQLAEVEAKLRAMLARVTQDRRERAIR